MRRGCCPLQAVLASSSSKPILAPAQLGYQALPGHLQPPPDYAGRASPPPLTHLRSERRAGVRGAFPEEGLETHLETPVLGEEGRFQANLSRRGHLGRDWPESGAGQPLLM